MTPLPETAQDIAEIIGRANTLALAAKLKHRKLYVPVHDFRPDHYIPLTIGNDAAKRLQFECRGLYLDLAKCSSIAVDERNTRIRKAHKEGQAVASLMSEHRMSLRGIRYVLAGYDGRRVNDEASKRKAKR